ncbi:MAG: NTP transferase domain-containing protein [Planctomycetaceae bacterium]|mgnify:CR=1 FL=1|nr:NTP transferase domain-containing protein [Planctomycetaceae bacterium]
MRYATVMAGGSGTRLWPMSRAGLPKQLIPFIRGRSLLEIAVDRLAGLVAPERQFICTGEKHRRQILAAMPGLADDRILGEPQGRDTLAAVGFPAAVAMRDDPDAVMAVFTADHLIEPIDDFQRRVEIGYRIAEQNPNTLVTFGIKPTHAATGFGYVEMGEPLSGFDQAYRTVRFVEKPDRQTAEQYVASGRYAWNSGMFVWRADTLLQCIRRYKPDAHADLMRIADAWGTPEQADVLEAVYPTLEKISVDFAVMEPASTDPAVEVATVSMPLRWLDVGSWPAYGETLEADPSGNRTACNRVVLLDSSNNLVVGDDPDHLIAAVGIENLVVVHTREATLICRRDHAEKIKQLHQAIGEKFGDEYL